MLSTSCHYALRTVLHLAAQPSTETRVTIDEVSRALALPRPFLSKVVQQLAAAGLVTTTRGVGGGIRLARAPREIRLLDVVIATDGPRLFTACVLGLPACSSAHPCPVHAEWGDERERLRALFAAWTLDRAAAEVLAGRGRLVALAGLDR